MPILTPLPFTLTNGTTADATQVMADLLSMFTNVNNYAAPLADAAMTDPTLTDPIIAGGTITGTGIMGGTIDGTATGVTQSPLTDNTTMATTEYVDKAVAAGSSGGGYNGVTLILSLPIYYTTGEGAITFSSAQYVSPGLSSYYTLSTITVPPGASVARFTFSAPCIYLATPSYRPLLCTFVLMINGSQTEYLSTMEINSLNGYSLDTTGNLSFTTGSMPVTPGQVFSMYMIVTGSSIASTSICSFEMQILK